MTGSISRNSYDEPRRRPSSRSNSLAERDRDRDRLGSSDVPTRKRRPRPESRSPEPPVDDWGDRDVEERPVRSSSRRPSRDEFDNSEPVPTRSRKRRPPEDISEREEPENLPRKAPDDYVDYQPIDPKDDETNSGIY